MDAPATLGTTAATGAAILAGGAIVGGVVGAVAASPSYKGVGGATGAVIGVLGTSTAGIVVAAVNDKWRGVGSAVALVGVGGLFLMSLLGTLAAKNALAAAPQGGTPQLLPPAPLFLTSGTAVSLQRTHIPVQGQVVSPEGGTSQDNFTVLPPGGAVTSAGAGYVLAATSVAGDYLFTWTDGAGQAAGAKVTLT